MLLGEEKEKVTSEGVVVMRFVVVIVCLVMGLSGCGVSRLVENRVGGGELPVVGVDVERGWELLGEGRCIEALGVTDGIWGREGGLFEDVTVLRLRSLVCLGRYSEALDLLRWMRVMFPWRGEDIDASELFIRHAMGEDVREGVWRGVRRYPFGWQHRLLGVQLLALEGRMMAAREQWGLLADRLEEMSGRCGYSGVVGRVGRGLEWGVGRVGVWRRFVPVVGMKEGVFERGGVLGVVMDYCHGYDEVSDWGGYVRGRLSEVFRRDDGSCEFVLGRGDYEEFFWRCIGGVDFEGDEGERVLLAGEYALRVGAVGIARTAGEALLRRGELEREARILLSRVWGVLGYDARSYDELSVVERREGR